MPKFAANLTLLFADTPFLDRFARARASEFRFIEFQFPYEHDTSALSDALAKNELKSVLFNLPPGNWNAGERGLAALPDRIAEFRRGVALAVEIAKTLGTPRLNCLAGNRDVNIPLVEQQKVLIENLRYASRVLGEHDIALVIEPLNPYDNPDFIMPTPSAAFAVQQQVASPNLHVQYDLYHAQRTEGELANTLQKNLARIGHIQIADNPGRHQPGTGEINYRFLLNFLDRIGYSNFVGLEYLPTGTTEDSFAWISDYVGNQLNAKRPRQVLE